VTVWFEDELKGVLKLLLDKGAAVVEAEIIHTLDANHYMIHRL